MRNWSDPEIESALITVLRPSEAPRGAMDRMLAQLPTRLPAPPWWRQRRVRYAVALALAAIGLVLGASPQARDAVANSVRQLFFFVPGQGIRSAPATSLVLDHPVVVSRAGITLHVVGVLATEQHTTVSVSVAGLPDVKTGYPSGPLPMPYLLDRSGHRYGGNSAAGGASYWTYGFDALPRDTRHVTLVVDSVLLGMPSALAAQLGVWRIDLPLTPVTSSALSQASPVGSSITVHGVTVVLAQVARSSDGVQAHLVAGGARSSQVDFLELAPPLTDQNYLPGSGQSGQWDLTLPANVTTIGIARVDDVEAGQASVSFNMPATGSLRLQRSVQLGRYVVVLERAEWFDGPNGHELRVYFHPGPALDGGHVTNWELDGVNSYGFAWADPSMASGYLELLNKPGPGHITLRMKNPHVVIEGPWELPVPAS
ncbi:MAG: hypothetical protein E6I88_08955 [Chloroflexi bacterium]|nr:MAG: hypothetical protein E6I88_08955 [Chloroflexota bacterium]